MHSVHHVRRRQLGKWVVVANKATDARRVWVDTDSTANMSLLSRLLLPVIIIFIVPFSIGTKIKTLL